MERKLPEYEIEGTSFYVDVMKERLIEVGNLNNTISFKDMLYRHHHQIYELEYHPEHKNRVYGFTNARSIDVEVPTLMKLDPEGMALRFGKTVEAIAGMTDYDLLIDQDLVHKRISLGKQPEINIMGQIFFVEIRTERLSPKGFPLERGIQFYELENYLLEDDKTYQITYCPKTRSFEEIGTEDLTAIPKGIYVIEFPCLERLDPIGYARETGWAMEDIIMENRIIPNMKARLIPIKDTWIPMIIRENLERKAQEKLERGKKMIRIAKTGEEKRPRKMKM